MDPNVQAALVGGGVTAFVWIVNRAVEAGKRLQKQTELTTHLTAQDGKLENIERVAREARDAVREQNGNVKMVVERTAQLDKRLGVQEALNVQAVIQSAVTKNRK